jgi:hypothetical protein
MTGRRGGEVEALRVLVRDVRDAHTPELDWLVVEEQLLERAEAASGPARVPPRGYVWPVVGGLAAAAALALGLRAMSSPPAVPVAQPVARVPLPARMLPAPTLLDGQRIELGAAIEAREAPLRIEHSGRASWSLERGSRARLVDRGESITVALDAGSLVARVVPSSRAESFAVEVDRARVAVHGTAFRVERHADGLLVEVSEGSVLVGPNGARSKTHGWLLVAPSHGTFALDGTKAGASGRAAPALPSPPWAAAGDARTTGSALPASPPMSAIETGVSRVLDATNRCFSQHTQRRGDIRIIVRSTMTLQVSPGGAVGRVEFAPPLAPAVEACARGAVGSVRFAESLEGALVTRTVELGP